MQIYFATSKPVTVNNITFSLNGQKLSIKQDDYIISANAFSGNAFCCRENLVASTLDFTRGQQILHGLGIPMTEWAKSYEDFENRRKAILDSHKVSLSDTYIREDFTYMTCSNNGKTKLLLAWVSDNVSSNKQLAPIRLALEGLGNKNIPGLLILV